MKYAMCLILMSTVFSLFADFSFAGDCDKDIGGMWQRVDIDNPNTYWTFNTSKVDYINREGRIYCTGDCNRSGGKPLSYKAWHKIVDITWSKAGREKYGCHIISDTLTISGMVFVR